MHRGGESGGGRLKEKNIELKVKEEKPQQQQHRREAAAAVRKEDRGALCDSKKMASSLTADSFYSLSTQHQFNYNKELIYVKLTDTALRAIEDYARNQVGTRPLPSYNLSHIVAVFLRFAKKNPNRIKSKKIFSFFLIRDVKEKKIERKWHT